MARSVYITSAEGNSGKSTVALGVIDALSKVVERVGVFRPVARSVRDRDYVLELMLAHDGVDTAEGSAHRLSYDMCVGVSYDDVHSDPDAALSRIVERYKAIEALSDVVVIVGSDYTDVGSPTELSYNARIAANLGAPVLLVLGGRVGPGRGQQLGQADARSPDDLRQLVDLSMVELVHAHATLLAVVVNRADPGRLDEIATELAPVFPGTQQLVWTIPEDPMLVAPSMHTLLEAVDGTLIAGDPALLEREAVAVVVAGMSMVNVLPRLIQDSVVIVAADRTDVLLAVLMAEQSGVFPSVSGVIVNGGFELPEPIQRLISGLDVPRPVIATDLGTYDTSMRVTHARGRLAADNPAKYRRALALFAEHVDGPGLVERLNLSRSVVVTPLMFEYSLIERARRAARHIVLPEGEDDRILEAAHIILDRRVATLTILGNEPEIRSRAERLGLRIADARIINPADSELTVGFAEEYLRLRAHKQITSAQAHATVIDPSYFGTMMVHLGLADGMVSGAVHTTAHTIRPGFEIIKTQPGVAVVSSVFLMALVDRVLVYGDCAVIPDPTADQLADIAISSAATAAQFGIEPRIAMLSYSTGASGTGADVEKVREATALVRARRPDLAVDGPIQYDAAVDAAIAATKVPGSQIAGRATVFIFPDLNTGNNTYKAVQRSAGAVAIGPVLQGLNKPINDLSRGALVQDIVNTIAITAIQAATPAQVPAARP